jgi:hypothetical protein
VDDRPGLLGHQVDHLGDRRGVVVAGKNDGARADERRLPSLVEEQHEGAARPLRVALQLLHRVVARYG